MVPNRVATAVCLSLVSGIVLGASAYQHSSKKLIGVVSKGQAHQFWQSIHAGAVSASREFNVDILWNGPSDETDITRQIQIVESMIARHVDGLAVAPAEQQALVRPVEAAVRAGIPVIVYDSGLNSDKFLSFVATNNYEAGEDAARKLAELMHGRGKIIELRHMPGSASSMDRERAFETVIAKQFPDMHIVGSQYGMSDRAKVLAAAENLLTAHPDVDGVFASAESSSVGAALALKARGLSGRVPLVAFDASPDLIQDLRDGTIDALVAQDPFKIGYEAVKALANDLSGQKPPKRIDLSAHVITRRDLGNPDIKALLFPDLKRFFN
jgi:ribose transport system substrate-binding protein